MEMWRIGELARATRVTVRALHHYDRLGLLVPSSRTTGGHRCYTGDDVRRLHVILALRGFGLTLAEIAAALDQPGADPREIVRRQLDQTDERIRQATRLRTRLAGVLGALDRLAEPSTSEFVTLIEEMVTMDQPLSPEKIQEMQQHRQEMTARLSPAELAEMNRRRQEATAALTPAQLTEMQETRARLLGT
jgi:DNA-binding transcriptional MerR regulator